MVRGGYYEVVFGMEESYMKSDWG